MNLENNPFADDPAAMPLPAPARAPEPWERDSRESDRDWQLFSLYRASAYPEAQPGSLGKFQPRKLARFARDWSLSEPTVYTLSSRHRWQERCAAYDRAIDRERTEATLTDVERLHEAHRRDYAAMREVGEVLLARVKDAVYGGLELKPAELLAWLKALQEGERLLHGEATSRSEHRITLNLDELRADLGVQAATPEERQAHRDALRAGARTRLRAVNE